MSKKFIITEEERNEIKSLYKINEGAGDIIPLLIKSIFMPTDDEESTDDQGSEESNSSIDLKNVSEKGQELLNNKLFKIFSDLERLKTCALAFKKQIFHHTLNIRILVRISLI